MATRVPLRLNERNDEVLELTITRVVDTEDLDAITSLELYLKADACQDDSAAELVLTTADPDQLQITSRTSTLITALAYIPGTALIGSYSRTYRVDGLVAARRRTAVFGPITVEPL